MRRASRPDVATLGAVPVLTLEAQTLSVVDNVSLEADERSFDAWRFLGAGRVKPKKLAFAHHNRFGYVSRSLPSDENPAFSVLEPPINCPVHRAPTFPACSSGTGSLPCRTCEAQTVDRDA
jgi:hypothetical protein